MKECPNCKTPLESDYAFCPECGQPVPKAPIDAAPAPAAAEPAQVAPAQPAAPAVESPVAAQPPVAPKPEEVKPAVQPSAPAKAPEPAVKGYKIIRLSRGGAGTSEHEIPEKGLTVGREYGDIVIPEDATLSPSHLILTVKKEGVVAEDAGSLNGIYLRVTTPQQLKDEDLFVCGDSVFRTALITDNSVHKQLGFFQAKGEPVILATVTRILEDGRDGEVFSVKPPEFVIGRDEGNAVFPQDRFMSRHHASIFSKNGDIYLNDANSRNGSYIRKEGAILLKSGDIILVGRQLLRIEAIT